MTEIGTGGWSEDGHPLSSSNGDANYAHDDHSGDTDV